MEIWNWIFSEVYMKCLGPADTLTAKILKRNRILSDLNQINVVSDVFWNNTSQIKDIYSYHFCKRVFPAVDNHGKIITHKIPVCPDNATTKKQRMQRIYKKYDIQTGLIKELNKNYVDEGRDALFHKLKNFQSHAHVCTDTIWRILLALQKSQETGLVLYVLYTVLHSHALCHMIYNTTGMQFLLQFQNTPYMKHIMCSVFQSMYVLHKEECIAKTYINSNSRYLFTIDIVHQLPSYHGDMYHNPYLPVSLSKKYMTSGTCLKPIPGDRGCYALHDFQVRFDIYTDFMFVDMSMDALWFCGSLLPACAYKNPLELLFGIVQHRPHTQDTVQHWLSQMDQVNAYFDEYYPSNTVITSQDPEHQNMVSDIDIIVNLSEDKAYDARVQQIYEHVRRTVPSATLHKHSTEKSYKYFITGTKRNIEIFRIYGIHPLGCVSRFHFPAVRGAYDGDQVYLLPSCVGFLQTGMFCDYKWMASSTDSKELILKYYIRGGACILNPTESELLWQYVKHTPKWHTLLRYQSSSDTADPNSPIFKPRKYNHGVYHDLPHSEYQDYAYIADHAATNTNLVVETEPIRSESGHVLPNCSWQIMKHVHDLCYAENSNSTDAENV